MSNDRAYTGGYDWRFRVDISGPVESHFSLKPGNPYENIRGLPPGEYEMTQFLPYYSRGGFRDNPSEIGIPFEQEPGHVTVLNLSFDMNVEGDTQYFGAHLMEEEEFAELIHELRKNENFDVWKPNPIFFRNE